MKTEIQKKAKDLAQKFLIGVSLHSFLKMELKDQLIGLACIAHMANDEEVRESCLEMIKFA